MEKSFSIADLRKGESAQIQVINAPGQTAQRLRDIGFTEGASVLCVGSGIFGDPAAYFVKGALIALRNRDAKAILCKKAVPTE